MIVVDFLDFLKSSIPSRRMWSTFGIQSTSNRLQNRAFAIGKHHPSSSKKMPASTPNPQGSLSPSHIPHGAYDSFGWESFEEWGGSKSVIFRAADGKTVVSAAKETGRQTLKYPCSEFFMVTEGWVKLNVHGGDEFTLRKGDVTFLPKGTTVDFEFGEGFTNIAVFFDNKEIDLI